jgi:hydroxyacylglutathione hydrolase
MIFETFEDPGLAQYSYAVGCDVAGAVAIVDPRRDVDVYLDFAKNRGLRIVAVLETHIHADFASGTRELGERTGAEVRVSGHDAGERYQVAFPHRDLMHGDAVEIGDVRIVAVHTPGHTPEHLSFLVYDGARSREVPALVLTGDFLFVGSLGRPDLIGEETKRGLAQQLFRSVRQKLAHLPDGLEIHPGHGAGSMCGSGMTARPMSTLGFERIANGYLDPALTEDAFVDRILARVPPFPPYYRRMKDLNSRGAPTLNGLPGMRPIDAARVRDVIEKGAAVIDVRDQLGFGAGHIPGSFGIGAGTNLSTWAAWVAPYDTPLVLIPPGGGGAPPLRNDGTEIADVVRALVRVGLDDVQGYLEGGIQSWIRAGYSLRQTPQLSPRELHDQVQNGRRLQIVDVRTDDEWRAGHVSGAMHLMAGHLAERLDDVRRLQPPLAIMCASGYRSTVAASVLERAGITDVVNITGGMNAWRQAGLPEVPGS